MSLNHLALFRTAAATALLGIFSIAGCASSPARSNTTPFSEEIDGLVVLSNGRSLEAAISPSNGGELSSLVVWFEGEWHELVYRARDYSNRPGWRGKASLLWPATGISISELGTVGEYKVADRIYGMPFHGFARDMEWRVLETTSSLEEVRVVLEISDDDHTRGMFPFGFRTTVEYRLNSRRLQLIYTVEASKSNRTVMPFSMGNHITFNAPLVSGSSAESLSFKHNLPEQLVTDDRRVFTGERTSNPYPGRTYLSELPVRRAVSLGGARGESSIELCDNSGLGITIRHRVEKGPSANAVDLNLWADVNEGFFSPEPWAGAQNSLNSGLGLVKLAPGQAWQWVIEIVPDQSCF